MKTKNKPTARPIGAYVGSPVGSRTSSGNAAYTVHWIHRSRNPPAPQARAVTTTIAAESWTFSGQQEHERLGDRASGDEYAELLPRDRSVVGIEPDRLAHRQRAGHPEHQRGSRP